MAVLGQKLGPVTKIRLDLSKEFRERISLACRPVGTQRKVYELYCSYMRKKGIAPIHENTMQHWMAGRQMPCVEHLDHLFYLGSALRRHSYVVSGQAVLSVYAEALKFKKEDPIPNVGRKHKDQLAELLHTAAKNESHEAVKNRVMEGFDSVGQSIVPATYENWFYGRSFPADHGRQIVLGNAVGGLIGEEIRNIIAPLYPRRSAGQMKHTRQFEMVSIPDGSGKNYLHAQIECTECGLKSTSSRNGSLEYVEIFRKKGWTVSYSDRGVDICPNCRREQHDGKVVNMADHKQDNKRTITPDDRRIILNSIDPNWDSKNKCYLVGWSDARISKDLGVDVSWVKESRELVYGGVGEDPQLEHLLAGYISAQAEMDEIQKSEREHDVAMLELRASVSNLEKHVNQNKEKITKLNDFLQGHAKIVAALTGQKKVG